MPLGRAPRPRLWGKSSSRAGLPDGSAYPLLAHLLDTGGVAGTICDSLVPQQMRDRLAAAVPGVASMGDGWEAWRSETVLAACWHDLGKATCGFQQNSMPDCDPTLREADASRQAPRLPEGANGHAWVSGLLAWDALCEADVEEDALKRIALVVGGHHGVVPPFHWPTIAMRGGQALINDPEGCTESLQAARRGLLDAISAASRNVAAVPEALPVAAAAMSHAVVVLADWIASSTEFLAAQQSAGTAPEDDPQAWLDRAAERTGDHLKRLGLLLPRTPSTVPSARFLLRAGNTPSALQASIERHHPTVPSGITVVVAPTGEGKTEAALLAASRYADASGSGGWYFAMPTMGTADGLRERLEGLLPAMVAGDVPMLHLMHSLCRLRDEPEGWDAADPQARHWMSSARRAAIAPCAVGTVDQVLMSVLRTKHSPLRAFATMRRTLIIDEAHTFDPYMRRLLLRLLEWAGALGTPVVMLSATLPQTLTKSFLAAYQRGAGAEPEDVPIAGYPGWTAWSPETGFSSSLTRVAPRSEWTLSLRQSRVPAKDMTETMADRALEAVGGGGCVLIVRESVSKAQQTFEETQLQSSEDTDVVLLHSRFRHLDRQRISERLLKRLGPPSRGVERPRRMIVVATQIVELSLDIDFDLVLSDPAPLGALLQRAGRCHRHQRTDRPDGMLSPALEVYWPLGSDSSESWRSPVYLSHDLRQAAEHLRRRDTISVPADVPDLVDAAHCDIADDGADYLQWLADDDTKSAIAATKTVPPPDRAAHKALIDLTSTTDDDIAPTRLGTKSVQILPVLDYGGANLRLSIDGPALPDKPDADQERNIYGHCVPVPCHEPNTRWLSHLDRHPLSDTKAQRSAWNSGPLARCLLLPTGADGTATVATGRGDAYRIRIDHEHGLRAERTAGT